MTPTEAADLAARTLAAIDKRKGWGWIPLRVKYEAADRERVASDLAGLRDEHGLSRGHRYIERDNCLPCARYADGLRRTARLYGVKP